jgi:hypothetical protein
VDIQVFSQSEKNVITRWIRFIGNGEVVTRARESADKPEYVVSLYLNSNYSCYPTSTMPYWSEEFLQTRGGGYHTLAKVACVLKNPAAFTEVE